MQLNRIPLYVLARDSDVGCIMTCALSGRTEVGGVFTQGGALARLPWAGTLHAFGVRG